MTIKNKQAAAQTMRNAFQNQGVIVAENTFFGVPVRAYFGEPSMSENPIEAPAAVWQIERAVSEQMMAQLEAMGVKQTNPTFFGILVSEYFGHTEKGIWQKIVEDLAALSHNAQPIN